MSSPLEAALIGGIVMVVITGVLLGATLLRTNYRDIIKGTKAALIRWFFP